MAKRSTIVGCRVHTFLFQEGLWAAKGEYVDEVMNRASLEGETRVTHGPDVWLNKSRMTLHLGGETVEIENLYRIRPFSEGSDFTSWESINPALGTLRGHFIIMGDTILSSCTSTDVRYTGTEFLLQESAGRYINRGTLFSASGRISSWSLILSRKG
jgi:hypothetical protein